MTLEKAREIVRWIYLSEFPWSGEISLMLTLLRTYGIADGTAILNGTSGLLNILKAHRRYIDTNVLYEMLFNPFSSQRSQMAFVRLRFLHSRHRITEVMNHGGIYLLLLIVCKPAEHIEMFDYRGLTWVEKHALHMVWKYTGEQLGFFTGIPDTYEGMQAYLVDIEATYMRPSADNTACADGTMAAFLSYIPSIEHGLIKDLVYSLVDDKFRESLSWPQASAFSRTVVPFVLSARRLFMRHLCLPRFSDKASLSSQPIDPNVPKGEERYFLPIWKVQPWYGYVQETFASRWGLGWGITGLISYLTGCEGPRASFGETRGYNIKEIGPRGLEKIGPGLDRPSEVEGVIRQRRQRRL